MALTIKFASEEENNDNFIEIDLNENIIDNREMFRQLFEKYKSIQKEQEEDISQFLNRLKNIEEILKVHEEPPVEENQNQENQENQEMQGELQNEEGHEQQLEGKSEEKNIEEQREIKEEKEEIKSSNKESMSSIQKGNNVKKGKVEKNKEEKKKNIKKKK